MEADRVRTARLTSAVLVIVNSPETYPQHQTQNDYRGQRFRRSCAHVTVIALAEAGGDVRGVAGGEDRRREEGASANRQQR
jgi:hypothetical protein